MKIFIIAGEASGDQHAAQVISELLKIAPNAIIKAWGGAQMEDAGAQIDTHIDELNFMGFGEVIWHLPKIIRLSRRCKKQIRDLHPDIILYVDFASFNMHIAHWAKGKSYTNLWYIAPKLWASRPGRITKLRSSVDHLFCIFPFEEKYFGSRGMKATYVGNPVVSQTAGINWKKTKSDQKIITLLPGSRLQEIKYNMPVFCELIKKRTDYSYQIIKAPQLSPEVYQPYLRQFSSKAIQLIEYDRYTTISQSNMALVASGTASLEVALIGTPQVVVYRTSILNYAIAKQIITSKYISLPNIILNRKAIDELIQKEFNFTKLHNKIDNAAINDIYNTFSSLKSDLQNLLGKKIAAANVAEQIIKAFKKS